MTSKFRTLVIAFAFLAVNVSSEVLQIEDGIIDGTTMTTRSGDIFQAFLNIPYAEPPTGELRFKPPQPAKPWTGTRLAKEPGPFCMQGALMQIENQNEDCLQLNVFTKSTSGQNLPVIVYIHGGAWEIGSGADTNPVLMMERDVVFVSINYRLGAFGFLSVGTLDAVGNQAQKDQVLALQWVQKNIKHFGGDSNRVTIMGMSAGAHSTSALVISPMSKDLFHGAIIQSGGITWQMDLENDYLETAQNLAKAVNCTTANIADMVKCLREVNLILFRRFMKLKKKN